MGRCYVIKSKKQNTKFYVLQSQLLQVKISVPKRTVRKYSKLFNSEYIENIGYLCYLFILFCILQQLICITSMILKIRYTLNLRKNYICVRKEKENEEQKKKHFALYKKLQ